MLGRAASFSGGQASKPAANVAWKLFTKERQTTTYTIGAMLPSHPYFDGIGTPGQDFAGP